MIARIGDIITATEVAIKSGFEIPPYAFNTPEKLHGVKGNEIIQNGRMFFKKPDGYDISYILFWTGKHFHGGYVSINSNYAFLDRGDEAEIGFVLFAEHLPEIKKKMKRLLKEAGIMDKEGFFIRGDFVLQEDGTLFYWGIDFDINKYIGAIEVLTGHDIDTIAGAFMEQSDLRIKKPSGFAGAMAYSEDEEIKMMYEVSPSITKAFENMYSKLSHNRRCMFLYGYERIFRRAYHILKKQNKLT
jgi:hypothetical protein